MSKTIHLLHLVILYDKKIRKQEPEKGASFSFLFSSLLNSLSLLTSSSPSLSSAYALLFFDRRAIRISADPPLHYVSLRLSRDRFQSFKAPVCFGLSSFIHGQSGTAERLPIHSSFWWISSFSPCIHMPLFFFCFRLILSASKETGSC
jgi:hypothetical protein